MKTLAIVILSALSLTAFAQNTTPAAKPATATAPVKAEAPKEEMKLAKKKDAPKADTKSDAKPASPAKADDKKAETSKK